MLTGSRWPRAGRWATLAPMRASRATFTCLLLVGIGSACSGSDVRTDSAFWLRAPGDPAMELTPAWGLSAPGVIQERVIFGTVITHRPNRERGLEKLLVVQDDAGTSVQVRYRIGNDRGLPIKVGHRVRLRAYRRQHPDDDGMDTGMLVYRVREPPTSPAITVPGVEGPAGPTIAPPKPIDDLVALLQMRGILADNRVPAGLRIIEPSDLDAYHESGTWDGRCFEMRSHQHFTVSRPEWLREVVGSGPSARLVAPGSRFIVDDGNSRFEVFLLDNRRTTRSSCDAVPAPTWSFAAFRSVRPTVAGAKPPTRAADPKRPGKSPAKVEPRSKPAM